MTFQTKYVIIDGPIGGIFVGFSLYKPPESWNLFANHMCTTICNKANVTVLFVP